MFEHLKILLPKDLIQLSMTWCRSTSHGLTCPLQVRTIASRSTFSGPNPPPRLLFSSTVIDMLAVIVRNALATAASYIGASVWTNLLSRLVSSKRLQPRAARKLMHITTAPLFSLTWCLYSHVPHSSLLAAAVPLSFAIRVAHNPASDNIVRAVARQSIGEGASATALSTVDGPSIPSVDASSEGEVTPRNEGVQEGEPNELENTIEVRKHASGPLAYALSVSLITATSWRSNAATYAALSALCFGDGFAEVVGSSCPSVALPLPRNLFHKRKTLAGTMACFLATLVGTLGWLHIPFVSVYVRPGGISTGAAAICASVAAAVEVLPVEDNLTVPVAVYMVARALQRVE